MDNEVAAADSWPIEATIRDYSKAGLIAEELQLHVRIHGGRGWQTIMLKPTDKSHNFRASMPGAKRGEIVDYYLSAADNSGRRETLPRTAPDNFYCFSVR